MSLRDTILTAEDLQSTTVDVPEWGVTVLLRGMTGKQRMQLVDQVAAKDKSYMYSDILIALALDPDTGKPIFDKADREALSAKSGGVLERLALEVMRISGVSVDEAEVEVETDPTSDGA